MPLLRRLGIQIPAQAPLAYLLLTLCLASTSAFSVEAGSVAWTSIPPEYSKGDALSLGYNASTVTNLEIVTLEYQQNTAIDDTKWLAAPNPSTNPTGSIPFTFPSTTNGSWHFRFVASTTGGGDVASAVQATTLDTGEPSVPNWGNSTPPEATRKVDLTLGYSGAGDTNGYVVTLQYQNKPDIESTAWINGPNVANTAAQDFTWAWPENAADGTWHFRFRIQDSAGNHRSSDSRFTVLDSTPPTTPSWDGTKRPGAYSDGSLTEMQYIDADDLGTVTLQYQVPQGAIWENFDSKSDSTTHSFPFSFSPATEGPWNFRFRAVDPIGNESFSTVLSTTLDTTPPKAPAWDPNRLPPEFIGTTNPIFGYTVDSDPNRKLISLQWDKKDTSPNDNDWNGTIDSDLDGAVTFSPSEGDGKYWFRWLIEDELERKVMSDARSAIIDRISPSVAYNKPSFDSNKNQITVTFRNYTEKHPSTFRLLYLAPGDPTEHTSAAVASVLPGEDGSFNNASGSFVMPETITSGTYHFGFQLTDLAGNTTTFLPAANAGRSLLVDVSNVLYIERCAADGRLPAPARDTNSKEVYFRLYVASSSSSDDNGDGVPDAPHRIRGLNPSHDVCFVDEDLNPLPEVSLSPDWRVFNGHTLTPVTQSDYLADPQLYFRPLFVVSAIVASVQDARIRCRHDEDHAAPPGTEDITRRIDDSGNDQFGGIGPGPFTSTDWYLSDATAPIVSVAAPPSVQASPSVQLSITATDYDGDQDKEEDRAGLSTTANDAGLELNYTIAGGAIGTLAPSSISIVTPNPNPVGSTLDGHPLSSTYTASYNFDALVPEGNDDTITFTVSAKDRIGNPGSSGARSIRIDRLAPSLKLSDSGNAPRHNTFVDPSLATATIVCSENVAYTADSLDDLDTLPDGLGAFVLERDGAVITPVIATISGTRSDLVDIDLPPLEPNSTYILRPVAKRFHDAVDNSMPTSTFTRFYTTAAKVPTIGGDLTLAVEGGSYTITTEDITAIPNDKSVPSQLLFTLVSAPDPAAGQLLPTTIAASGFTQQALATGQVSFEKAVPNGSASFALTVTNASGYTSPVTWVSVTMQESQVNTQHTLTIDNPSHPQYVDDGLAVPLFAAVNIDNHGETYFSNRLTVAFDAPGSHDWLKIVPQGLLTVSGTKVSYNGDHVATITSGGIGGEALGFNLLPAASDAATEALLTAVHYEHTQPKALLSDPVGRTVRITMADQDFSASDSTRLRIVAKDERPDPPILVGLATPGVVHAPLGGISYVVHADNPEPGQTVRYLIDPDSLPSNATVTLRGDRVIIVPTGPHALDAMFRIHATDRPGPWSEILLDDTKFVSSPWTVVATDPAGAGTAWQTSDGLLSLPAIGSRTQRITVSLAPLRSIATWTPVGTWPPGLALLDENLDDQRLLVWSSVAPPTAVETHGLGILLVLDDGSSAFLPITIAIDGLPSGGG